MSEGSPETAVETELDRDIGLVGALALGIGTMIAAGIFVLSGLAVSNVGAMAIVAFLLAAVVASFTAFAYAEFAAIYPEAGGGYAYVANTFDTDVTYIVGWSMILGYPASAAFYLASFSDWFTKFVLPGLGAGIASATPYWVSGLGVLALLVALNVKGTEESGQFQIVVTALKVALIGLFLVGGLQAFDAATISTSFAENADRFREIGLTSALVFITFFGFEAIATNAEEIERPGRNVPRAIFISMGFVTLVYALVVLVVVLALNTPDFLSFLARQSGLAGPAEAEAFVRESGEIAMGRAAQYYLGDLGFYVIILGALFSMLSAANATILAGSRVKLAMARRDHLPTRFERLHDRFNTPHAAVLFTGSLILLFVVGFTVLFGQKGTVAVGPVDVHLGIEAIAHFADFMLLSGLIVVNLAVIYSRRNEPDIERPFRVPGVPWVPAIAVLANLVLLVNVEPTSFALGLLAQLVGVGLWVGVISTPSAERIERETPTAVTHHTPADRDYQVLVPVANPQHVEQLMRTAGDLAAANDGEVLVVSVVTLPEQTPLSEGHKYVADRRAVIEEAMAFFADREVPVGGVVRIGHHPSDAIVHTATQHDSDAIVLGWSGTGSRRRDIVLGSTVDEVVREARCDVRVEKIDERDGGPIESILVPIAGGPHGEFALQVAAAVARPAGAEIRVTHVVPPNADADRRADAERLVTEAADGLADLPATGTVLEGPDVVETIVAETAGHDLTIIGATREGLLQELVFGAVPEAVGARAHNTVVMTKQYLGLPGRVRRWLRWE